MYIFSYFSWIQSFLPTFEKLSPFLNGRVEHSTNFYKISLACVGIYWFESNFSWSYASEQPQDSMPSAGARAASRPLLALMEYGAYEAMISRLFCWIGYRGRGSLPPVKHNLRGGGRENRPKFLLNRPSSKEVAAFVKGHNLSYGGCSVKNTLG